MKDNEKNLLIVESQPNHQVVEGEDMCESPYIECTYDTSNSSNSNGFFKIVMTDTKLVSDAFCDDVSKHEVIIDGVYRFNRDWCVGSVEPLTNDDPTKSMEYSVNNSLINIGGGYFKVPDVASMIENSSILDTSSIVAKKVEQVESGSINIAVPVLVLGVYLHSVLLVVFYTICLRRMKIHPCENLKPNT